METITWKNSDLSGRNFDFEAGNTIVGKLTRLSELSSNATYVTDKDEIQFQRVGFLDNKILIKKNGVYIGEIGNRLIGQTSLKLKSGQVFRLASNLVGRNLKWVDSNGLPIVEYSFATLKTMRKGSVKTSDSISIDAKEVLLSSGLIAGWFNAQRLPTLFLFGCLFSYLAYSLASYLFTF
jgi:hypothetical protein